ncbi:uncharacterized protein PITG_16268 [Phytophthora infestans T30-4]|uniref:M96 mating-specific protein family n=1 Tax=Phytophthora infestans (strain T30-4) TaxID=403677 RepID=D0NTH8_PHYIT|nr:uncharacterized protein PITG_16268 [Phytophthora infestans T30-4]EEY64929.1 conserved hypothetical protein [Phytophthora infestans T30-4]|eukprot:XP_002897659.1 conserved hypothetical protein [Phytophthora infestans T30-4]
MDVSEVLTLLDTIDSIECDSSSATSLDFDRRRKEGPVRYTTSLQRHKKLELKALREEAQQLNAQLEELMLSRLSHMVPAITPHDHNPNVWRSFAMIESEGRERAERTNRKLKVVMANQVKVHASISKILGRSDVLQGVDVVFKAHPTSDRSLQHLDFSDAILAKLSASLGRLRSQADNVLPALDANPSITCSSQTKHLNSGRNCAETFSITPLACPMQKTAQILWHHIMTKKNKDTQKSFRFVRTRNPNSVERNCVASLPDGKKLVINLDAVNIVHRLEEGNQIVLVGTTAWFLPTGGLQFEDHHWTIISPSLSNPLHASVVRILPLDFAHVEEVVIRSIGGKLRNVLQLQQNVLLEQGLKS